MLHIKKARESMTARERVMRTFHHEKADRVPIDYSTNPGIHRRLAAALGIPDGNYERVMEALGVDFYGIGVPYSGKPLFPEIEGTQVNRTLGSYTRWIPNRAGGYWDYCVFPLKDADDEVIASYPVPDPDDFDYDNVERRLSRAGNYCVHCGSAGEADIINTTGMLMGMENALVNLATEHEATLYQLDRRHDCQLAVLERILERAKGRIDFLWMGEDLGTQHAPMISTDLYDRVFRPRHQRFIDLARAYGIPCMIHTCGSSSWAYERLIEMGMSGVDTLQPEAADMAPDILVRRFGGRLSFHGCISTAGALAYGTPDDVRADVKRTLDIMMLTCAYHLAPTHQIQDNSPVENVVAMYQAAHDYGVYQ